MPVSPANFAKLTQRTAALIVLGLTMFTAAACSDDSKNQGGAPTAAAPTSAAASAGNSDEACDAFKALFEEERMTKVGVPIGELIAYRNAKQDTNAKKAEDKVRAEFDKLRDEVKQISTSAGDPELQAKF